MKIITIDNFNRDYYPERIVAQKIESGQYAKIMCRALQEALCDENSPLWFSIVDDRYKCEKGIEYCEIDWETQMSISHWGVFQNG